MPARTPLLPQMHLISHLFSASLPLIWKCAGNCSTVPNARDHRFGVTRVCTSPLIHLTLPSALSPTVRPMPHTQMETIMEGFGSMAGYGSAKTRCWEERRRRAAGPRRGRLAPRYPTPWSTSVGAAGAVDAMGAEQGEGLILCLPLPPCQACCFSFFPQEAL
ncbi:Phosphatidylinositol/phosphatidylcholine transfer protein SFH8 [Zea mays]|uniref:Phosphatidylinositol/phosphatidylcholine transfer protein SFH8 n=1 Tax=Zea mays TaxID=4577 RepID=A0A1D6LG71_MAIZE|nr:Phosphatidylinositol/phosphatidylcholine transfer protein SFH8 [Zea mays]